MARAKKKTTRSRKKKGLIRVNFEGVESGGGRPIPDGHYVADILKIEEKEGEESGQPYLSLQYKISEGSMSGAKVFDNVSLQPQSLWRLRTILECIGYEVEEAEMEIDSDEIIGESIGIEVTNEEYDGRDRARITGFMPPDAVVTDEEEEEAEEEGEEEEEEEAPKKRRSRKKKPEPEEEEEEEEEYEEEEEEEPAPKKKKGKARAKKIRAGSKVKFEDEEGDTVKGVVTELDEDTAWVEDSAGETWEVELSEVTAV